MRIALLLVLSVGLVSLLTGCMVWTEGAVMAPIQITKSPVEVGDTTVGMSKVGRSQAEGIILVSFGDATIATAAKAGNITKIHHVDSEEINVLGLYARKTIVVYGE